MIPIPSHTWKHFYKSLKNVVAWASLGVANAWTPYGLTSEPTDNATLYKGQMFGTKDKVVHAIKTFSTSSHPQYFVCKSTISLLS